MLDKHDMLDKFFLTRGYKHQDPIIYTIFMTHSHKKTYICNNELYTLPISFVNAKVDEDTYGETADEIMYAWVHMLHQ